MSRLRWIILALAGVAVVAAGVLTFRSTDLMPPAPAYEDRLAEAVDALRVEAGSPSLREDECLTKTAARQTEFYLGENNLRPTLDSVDCEGLELFHERPVRSASSPEEIAQIWARPGVRYDLIVDPAATHYGLSCFTYDPHPDMARAAPMTCTLIMASEVDGG